MRQFSPSARNLLVLILAQGFLHGLVPNTTRKSYLLLSVEAARHPMSYTAALPLIYIGILVLVSFLRIESRPIFVGGIVLAAVGIVVRHSSEEYWIFAVANQAVNAGNALFVAAAFVLEAQRFPRRWLFIGPFAYAVVFGIAEWISPYILWTWVSPPNRGLVCGGLLVILALVATSQFLIADEPKDEEGRMITLGSRGRLMLLVGVLVVSLVFPSYPVPERYWPHLGTIGPFDPWRVLGIVLGQLVPLAIGGVILARWRGVGSGIRALASMILLLVAIGWAIPAVRSSVRSLADPLYSWAIGLTAIALARGTRGTQRLRSALAVQILTGIAGSITYYAVATSTWRGWRPTDPPPASAWPLGLTASLLAVLGTGLYLLLAPAIAPIKPEDDHVEPLLPATA